MQERPSRRSVLASAGALAFAGLAGCTGGNTGTDATTDTTATGTADATATERAPSVDWSEVADFRTWLTEYSTLPSSNARFDYQSVGLGTVIESGRASFLDLSVDNVDGVLFQSGNTIVLGSFNRSSLSNAVEVADDHEVTGEYEGYTTAEAVESETKLALGEDAVLAGSDLPVYIDTHRGERERLEETDPVFTTILGKLPERGIVAGQYGPPAGGEIDAEAIEAWGTSMASVDADTGTWVYAFESGTSDETVEAVESGLAASALTDEVTDRSEDGRFVTFTATMADLG